LLAAGDLALCKIKYEKTFHNLEGLRGLGDEDFARVMALKTTVALNLAAALQRGGEHAAAQARLRKVLDDDPDNVKALWRRSVSALATHEYAAAREDLACVAELDPTLGGEVDAQLRRVRAAEEENLGKEKRRLGGIL